MPPALHLAHFRCDVTPPPGHPLCGGLIEPVRGVDDPLRAVGVVLLGGDAPIVLCAVDWCGIRNDAHAAWRRALADAAHTTAERVAVQSIHAHDAPFADLEAQKLAEKVPGVPTCLDRPFFDRVVARTADAVKASLARTEPINRIGLGKARVEDVASNRRLVGADGKVWAVRYSGTKDPKVRAEPEGLIDPWLRTISFWDSDTPRAALHYYATHPMSHYGAGRVSSDFCGLARDARAAETAKVAQVYFTGCAGNVTAGKYNDGAPANRAVLRDRILTAMRAAWKATETQPLKEWHWRVEPLKLSGRREASFGAAESRKVLDDPKASKARRVNAAFQLAWLKRIEQPIDVTCLDLGAALVLHLPGEPFVEYQLKAQEIRKDRFVATAGYGDGGPGYIPVDRAFLEGGYEPTVALAAPCEKDLVAVLTRLLKP
jgi:hypothetical protein